MHERVAPGFLTGATRDGDDRILTFFSGFVARERFLGRDEATRRIAYTIVEGRRVVWIADILPYSISTMMEHGAEAMARTLAD